MTERSAYLPIRVPAAVYEQVKALAAAETGENVSKMGRKLLAEAIEARSLRTQRTQSRDLEPVVANTAHTTDEVRAEKVSRTTSQPLSKVEAAKRMRARGWR